MECRRPVGQRRSARHPFGGPRSVDGWWDWRPTTMLEGLYQGGLSTASMPGAQPRALGGKCYLIGNLVIKQLKVPPDSLCEPPPGPSSSPGTLLPFSELVEDSFPTCGPKDGGPETPSVIDPEIQRVAPGGPRGSQEESSASGQHKYGCLDAAALTGPRASGWIDRSTRAVSMHFTLYNPPTQLFSSVSLSAEMLPTGDLTVSSLLESVTILCRDSAPLYHLLLPELVFLVLSLTHLCFQFHGMIGILLSKSCSAGGWKSEIKVSAGLVSPEASLACRRLSSSRVLTSSIIRVCLSPNLLFITTC
ncbi:LOW QUALITY PROTEIN: polycystin-1-like protein 1 [Eschrichtius robustus]|uniref:LOW QUALITY PROTEIN: polycystin-1-like protein 1 n=1 Tax=Eschrichtius robustus TaxID=9764 RepID=UPI0035C1CF09